MEAEAEAEALAARADRGVLLPGRRWQRAEEQMPGGGPVASGPPALVSPSQPRTGLVVSWGDGHFAT